MFCSRKWFVQDVNNSIGINCVSFLKTRRKVTWPHHRRGWRRPEMRKKKHKTHRPVNRKRLRNPGRKALLIILHYENNRRHPASEVENASFRRQVPGQGKKVLCNDFLLIQNRMIHITWSVVCDLWHCATATHVGPRRRWTLVEPLCKRSARGGGLWNLISINWTLGQEIRRTRGKRALALLAEEIIGVLPLGIGVFTFLITSSIYFDIW